MHTTLPDDILYVLCEVLADQDQFDTLFNCATASKALAVPALTHLYRVHHKAPVKGGGEDEAIPTPTKWLIVQKWSILWKSLIASSLDETQFPYCRYIRALDFRDLENLFEDNHFQGKIYKAFFAGSLARFYKAEVKRYGKRVVERLDIAAIIDSIGELMTTKTPMLESISGKLNSTALTRWAPRLPKLQELELWDGSALEDALVPEYIHKYCPDFNHLMIFAWYGQDRDHKFAQFLSAMRPNSLKIIHTINDIGASAETFLALNSHGQSLTELRISLSNDSLPHLSLLAGCTEVEALRIEGPTLIFVPEEPEVDELLEIIDWLRKCNKLQRLSFAQMVSAPALITPVLLEHKIQLQTLEIDSYVLKDSRQFHQALVHQKESIMFLSLNGDTEGLFRDDIDILVDSLKQMTKLRVLRLLIQETFQEEHLCLIISRLHLLEELYINGLELGDRILDFVGTLDNLWSVTLAGISKFTFDGLLEFISRLGPGNQGIRIMIDMADPDTLLPDNQISMLKDILHEKVEGTLDYTPWRDPNISEFEGDSD